MTTRPTKRTAGELASQVRELTMKIENMVSVTDGEITDDIEPLFEELDALKVDVADKLDGYGYAIESIEQHRESINAVAEYYQERADKAIKRATAIGNHVDRMRERAKYLFLSSFNDHDKVDTPRARYYVQSYKRMDIKGVTEADKKLMVEELGYGKIKHHVTASDIKQAVSHGKLKSPEDVGAMEITNTKIRGL